MLHLYSVCRIVDKTAVNNFYWLFMCCSHSALAVLQTWTNLPWVHLVAPSKSPPLALSSPREREAKVTLSQNKRIP